MDFNTIFSDLNVRLPEDVQRRKMQGDFAGAVRLIDRKLAGELSDAMRRCLTVQREIIRGRAGGSAGANSRFFGGGV